MVLSARGSPRCGRFLLFHRYHSHGPTCPARRSTTSANGGQTTRPERTTAYARRRTSGSVRGSTRTPGATGRSSGQQPDAEPGDDQVLHEVEAVGAVRRRAARTRPSTRGCGRRPRRRCCASSRSSRRRAARRTRRRASPALLGRIGRNRRGPRAPTTAESPRRRGRAPPARACSRRPARDRPRRAPAARGPRAGSCSCDLQVHRGVRRSRGGRRRAAASGGSPWRTRRCAACRPARLPGRDRARAASTAARIVTACSARRRPAGVSRTRRPTGSTAACRPRAASTAICWETVDVVTSISSATARIEPSRDSSSRSCRRRVSIA